MIELVQAAARAGCPIFGICLGHQLIVARLRREDLSR
ncbi:MAG: glutamine amidotransferase-related protein [Alistipes sp.]